MKNYVRASQEAEPYALEASAGDVHFAEGVPIDEVEPMEEIRDNDSPLPACRLGALGPEAHECLAIAMNRIGGKSN